MKHAIQTEVTIDAPPHAVWNILTDLASYSEWNPFITEAAGTVAPGSKLKNRMQNPGGKAMTIKPVVTAVEPAQTFEWLGHFGFPGVFDGRHRFELTETPTGGTHMTHSEKFSGVLVRLLRKSLDTQTIAGFEAMNDALKSRTEASVKSAT